MSEQRKRQIAMAALCIVVFLVGFRIRGAQTITVSLACPPTPTPTPDGGQITITADTDAFLIDGQCYFLGREGSCDDWMTAESPTPTPTLEHGGVHATGGSVLSALFGVIGDDGCWVDVPWCGSAVGICPSEWGREVSCDDMESTVTPTPTPTPDPDALILPYDLYEDAWLDLDLTSQWNYSPTTPDDVLFINWPYTILITDAFSQTTIVKGPATVRFSEEDLP